MPHAACRTGNRVDEQRAHTTSQKRNASIRAYWPTDGTVGSSNPHASVFCSELGNLGGLGRHRHLGGGNRGRSPDFPDPSAVWNTHLRYWRLKTLTSANPWASRLPLAQKCA